MSGAAPRPVVTAGDTKAIRQAARAKDRVLALAKDIGLHASKTRPKTAPKAKAIALPEVLKLLSEHTN